MSSVTTTPTAAGTQQQIPGASQRYVLPERIQRFGRSFAAGGFVSTAVALLFYTSATLFVLFLILTFIHYTIYPVFSFNESDDGIISIPTASDRRKAYTGVVAAADMSANIVAAAHCGYTISFDTYLSGDFFSTNAPRVMLYRSRVPVPMNSSDREDTILDRFPDTNLLVYLDPMKNDLIVAVATSDESAARKTLLKLPPIQNVPMRKVFRTTIVFTENFIEAYINGKLQQSMPLSQKPVQQDPAFDFYTTPALFGSSVKLANMMFWPRALKSRDVRANGDPIAPDTLFSPTKS